MSTTYDKSRSTALPTIASEFTVPLIFSLLGLVLSAAILPHFSDETISTIFSSIGFG